MDRLADAAVLFAEGRWAGSYYFFGLAVELALKACVAKTIAAETIPEKSFTQAFYSHSLRQLVGLAELDDDLTDKKRDAAFAAFWAIVDGWSVSSRYEAVEEQQARAIEQAVTGENGVHPWLTTLW